MTTRVVVQNDAQSQLNIGVRAANRGQEPSESDVDSTIGPGAESEFWIHDGYDLTVSELQGAIEAKEPPQTDAGSPPSPTDDAAESDENQSDAADSEGSGGDEALLDRGDAMAGIAEDQDREVFPRQTVEIKVGNKDRDLGCVIDRPGSEERFMLQPFTTYQRELGRDDVIHIFPVWGEAGEAFHTAIAEQTDSA